MTQAVCCRSVTLLLLQPSKKADGLIAAIQKVTPFRLCSVLSTDMEIWPSLGDPMAQEFKWIPADLDSVLACTADLGKVKNAESCWFWGQKRGEKGIV